MFCKECGAENRNDGKFCSNCGAKLTDYTKTPTQEELLMPQDVVDNTNKQKQAKKHYRVRQVVSIILIICACACVLISNLVIKNNRTLQLGLSCLAIILSVVYIGLIVTNAKYLKKIKNEKSE